MGLTAHTHTHKYNHSRTHTTLSRQQGPVTTSVSFDLSRQPLLMFLLRSAKSTPRFYTSVCASKCVRQSNEGFRLVTVFRIVHFKCFDVSFEGFFGTPKAAVAGLSSFILFFFFRKNAEGSNNQSTQGCMCHPFNSARQVVNL